MEEGAGPKEQGGENRDEPQAFEDGEIGGEVRIAGARSDGALDVQETVNLKLKVNGHQKADQRAQESQVVSRPRRGLDPPGRQEQFAFQDVDGKGTMPDIRTVPCKKL